MFSSSEFAESSFVGVILDSCDNDLGYVTVEGKRQEELGLQLWFVLGSRTLCFQGELWTRRASDS